MEIWKPIRGYEGLYSVSNLGRVRSEARRSKHPTADNFFLPERIKKTPVDGKGYPRVALYKDNRQKHPNVHVLVMEAFVGPRPEGMQVCHNNGDRLDCRLENLRYGTDRENKLDTVKHGTHRNARKTHCKWGHEFTPENTYVWGPRKVRICRACSRRRARSQAK